MPGIDPYSGHPIEGIVIEREIYYLAAIFGASKRLYEMTPDTDGDAIEYLRVHWERSEASRLLLSVAVMLRNLLDAAGANYVTLRLQNRDMIVGSYFIGRQKGKTLYFREACNKIIHAMHVDFDVAASGKHKMGYLRPRIRLYGEHRRVGWRAVMNVLQFARVAYYLC